MRFNVLQTNEARRNKRQREGTNGGISRKEGRNAQRWLSIPIDQWGFPVRLVGECRLAVKYDVSGRNSGNYRVSSYIPKASVASYLSPCNYVSLRPRECNPARGRNWKTGAARTTARALLFPLSLSIYSLLSAPFLFIPRDRSPRSMRASASARKEEFTDRILQARPLRQETLLKRGGTGRVNSSVPGSLHRQGPRAGRRRGEDRLECRR